MAVLLEKSVGPDTNNLISTTRANGNSNNRTSYYLTDALGSVRQVLSERGKTMNTYSYTPFGEAFNVREAVAQPFRYTGRRWDENVGKQWSRSRHYDAGRGRFSQADKWLKSVGNPVGYHAFGYVNGNPMRWVDPMGLFTITTAALEKFQYLDWGLEVFGNRLEKLLSQAKARLAVATKSGNNELLEKAQTRFSFVENLFNQMLDQSTVLDYDPQYSEDYYANSSYWNNNIYLNESLLRQTNTIMYVNLVVHEMIHNAIGYFSKYKEPEVAGLAVELTNDIDNMISDLISGNVTLEKIKDDQFTRNHCLDLKKVDDYLDDLN